MWILIGILCFSMADSIITKKVNALPIQTLEDNLSPFHADLGAINYLSRQVKHVQADWHPSLPNAWSTEKLIRLINTHHYLHPPTATLQTAFVDPASLNDYLATLDPYSKFLSAAQQAFYEKRNEVKQIGLGLNILVNNETLLAVPLYNAPAFRAGFTKPRYLKTVNGKTLSVTDVSSFSFLADLPSGRQISIYVSETKHFQPIEKYTVTSGAFHNDAIEYLTDNNFNLIRIHTFDSRGITRDLKAFLHKAVQQNHPIIIDLRYCPGGSLYEAIDAVSLLIPPDIEVSYLKKAGGNRLRPLTSLPGQVVRDQKIYLWVSPFTASAAEIFARILRRYANAVIVGTPTQGKCLSQRQFEFEDGTALQLSVFEILGPDKKACQAQAIRPDVVVEANHVLNSQYYFNKSLGR